MHLVFSLLRDAQPTLHILFNNIESSLHFLQLVSSIYISQLSIVFIQSVWLSNNPKESLKHYLQCVEFSNLRQLSLYIG